MNAEPIPFPRPEAPPGEENRFLVDLEGYEGPIDVLLQLARDQKVDITRLSILALAEQYLAFIQEARRLRLELAADYLVMAAWLAYLKSRLLLPEPDKNEDEPSGPEMAAALRFQLQRVQAMRDAAEKLFARPLLGRESFARGEPEPPAVSSTTAFEASLFELLKAYAAGLENDQPASLKITAMELYSVDEARQRLARLLGDLPGWRSLDSLLPSEIDDDLSRRSAVASTFGASLELCREGRLKIRQDGLFGPIYLRNASE